MISSQEKLLEGIDALKLDVSTPQLAKLLEFKNNFEKWNKVTNLSAHRSDVENIEKNFLDCLYLAQSIHQEKKIIDFGSGAGFPGLILSIMDASRSLFLLEADQKKSSFLKSTIVSLKLTNVDVINSYYDVSSPSFVLPDGIDLIVSRATISPAELMKVGERMTNENIKIALMLSEKQKQSLKNEMLTSFEMENEVQYVLPWSKSPRFINFLRKK